VVERPEDADVDSEDTELLVVDRPVESELIPLDAEVESEATLLLVVDRPEDADVDNEPM
jgi:hypothetical protein